eukprot:1307433-Heterocapsa_arctica.AAC.1
MKQMRALLHGDAYGITNQAVRTQLHCPTIVPRLRASRVKWMQAIAKHPEQRTVFLGSLAGNSVSGPLQLVGDHPADLANPWLKQLWNDFEIAAQRHP